MMITCRICGGRKSTQVCHYCGSLAVNAKHYSVCSLREVVRAIGVPVLEQKARRVLSCSVSKSRTARLVKRYTF